jgi:hypothetical protein
LTIAGNKNLGVLFASVDNLALDFFVDHCGNVSRVDIPPVMADAAPVNLDLDAANK